MVWNGSFCNVSELNRCNCRFASFTANKEVGGRTEEEEVKEDNDVDLDASGPGKAMIMEEGSN